MTPACNFSHPANLSAESKGVPGVQQTKVHSASSDEVFNQLSTHVTSCTAPPHLFVATTLGWVADTFPSQNYRDRAQVVIQSLHQDPYSLSPSGSSGSSGPPGPRATDPAAHYGPRTWAMGGQEKKKDAGRGRNKKGRKGEAARQGEQISLSVNSHIFMPHPQIIQKIHTTMDFLLECQYLEDGRKR